MLRPACRLHTRQAGRFYALCELNGEELAVVRRSPAVLFRYPVRIHRVADCDGNSRKGPVVGTFGKVVYTENDR